MINYEFFLIETKQKASERFKNRPIYHLARKSREKSNRDSSSLECKQQLLTKVRPFQCVCRVFLRPKRSSRTGRRYQEAQQFENYMRKLKNQLIKISKNNLFVTAYILLIFVYNLSAIINSMLLRMINCQWEIREINS